MSPSLATGKPAAPVKVAAPAGSKPPPLNTATVRPAQVSPAKRFVPHYVGEPVAGFSGVRLQNPDGSWVKPGGKFQPGAHIAPRPYYTDAFTTKHGAGPAGDPSTQWNAAQVAAAKKTQIENYGTPGYLLRSMIPGGLDEGGAKNIAQAVARGADVASWFVPPGAAVKGAGLFGLGIKGLRGIRAVKAGEAVTEEIPAATAAAHTSEAAAVVRGALPGAKAARTAQEASDSAERGKRFAAARTHLNDQSLPWQERVAKAKSELRGELPVVGINYKGFTELDGDAMTVLQNDILNHPHLSDGQKLHLSTALVNAVAAEGRPLTRSEILLMQHVFGKNSGVAAALENIDKSPWKDVLLNVLNIPRSVSASFDFSAPFRQGLVVATRHPVIFARNLGPMFKSFGSEGFYQGIHDEIRARQTYPLMVEAKLPLTDLGRGEGGFASGREERFDSSYAEWLGGKYNPVRASGRAYTGFLDKTRADVFDHLLERAQAQGHNIHDPHFLESLGRYIGSATGRGSLKMLEGAARELNAIFFSPRLMASRFNFLSPNYYRNLHPFARKEALRSVFQLAGTVSTLLALASRVPGVKVNLNPTNPDWGKIRIGNTRIDLAGGFQQQLRLAAQIALGRTTSSTTGKTTSLTSGKFGQPTRLSKEEEFFFGKASPIAGLIVDLQRGSNQIGQKATLGLEAQRLLPLIGQDSYDLYKENHGGMNGLLAAFAGYGVGSVGFGVQTYDPKAPKGGSGSGSGSLYDSGSGGGGSGSGSIYDTPGSSGSTGSIYDSP